MVWAKAFPQYSPGNYHLDHLTQGMGKGIDKFYCGFIYHNK